MEGYILLERQLEGTYGGLLARPEHPKLVFEQSLVSLQEALYQAGFGNFPAKHLRNVREWIVLPISEPGTPRTMRRYAVFRERKCHLLHRKFARIALAPIERRRLAILRFANDFGFLGLPEFRDSLVPPGLPIEQRIDMPIGEPLRFWWTEACRMAAFVALWDRVRDGDLGEVQKYVFLRERPYRIEVFLAWDKGRLTTDRRFDVDWRIPTIRQDDGGSDWAEVVVGGGTSRGEYRRALFPPLANSKPDFLLAARLFLLDQINHELDSMRLEFRLEAPSGPIAMLAPQSLLAALYVHFAWEIVGRRAAGSACVVCHTPMHVTRRGHRYCSPTCRKAAERQRKRHEAAVQQVAF